MNIALVIDPEMDNQIVVPIQTDNPWASLTRYIQNKSNIFFCPSERQLSLAIEYMQCPLDTSIMMSDRYSMYRLSSPEQLFKGDWRIGKGNQCKAVIFGGLKYGALPDSLDESSNNLLAFRGVREAVSEYEFLNSTYDEALYIDSIFRKHRIEVALLTITDRLSIPFPSIIKSITDNEKIHPQTP